MDNHFKFDCSTPQLIAIALGKGIDNARGRGFAALNHLRQLKEDTVLKAEWRDYRKDLKDYAPPNMWKQRVFENCISWIFCLKTQTFNVTFWEGDFDGNPEKERCYFQFSLDRNGDEFDKLVRDILFRELRALAERMYEEEQQRLRDLAIAEVMSGFFSPV